MENYDQFFTSKNIVKSLELIKEHTINQIKNNLIKLNIKDLDYANFTIPSNIDEFDKDTQYLLTYTSHLCEYIIIIEKKIGEKNG